MMHRRGFRLFVAAVLAGGLSTVASLVPTAAHAVGTGCGPSDGVPPVGPGVGSLYEPAQTCVDAHQSLIFVGESFLTDAVNFAGTGTGAGGFTYEYVGYCVLVNWDDATQSTSIISGQGTTGCDFQTTNGHVESPNNSFVGDAPTNGLGLYTAPLFWGPSSANGGNQPGCLNSNGGGISTFTTKDAAGNATSYSSNYTWTNTLNNFTGSISTPSGLKVFNAKIQTAADPAADFTRPDKAKVYQTPLDRTDAGCLDKNINMSSGLLTAGPTLGLSNILVVGTATWDMSAPGTP